MSDEYRRVLHEWARTQLEIRTRHTGPFEIKDVCMYTSIGGSYESNDIEIMIVFEHSGCSLNPRYDRTDGVCVDRAWNTSGNELVNIMNELFAIAARQETHP